MGQAFHRKRICVDRSQIRGTGYKYVDVVPPDACELTPEQLAAREAEAQQQVALDEQRRFQQANVNALCNIARDMLQKWKEAMDSNDRRLIDFAGWTTSNYCALPVDEDVADYYHDQIESYKRQTDEPVSVDELDEVIRVVCQRRVPTEQIVEEATKAVRYVAQACTNFKGVDLARVAQMLSSRASRVAHKNTGRDSALCFVSKMVEELAAQLKAEE